MDGHAAIQAAAARTRLRRWVVRVRPEWTSGHRIERDDVVWRLNDIHNAVDDDRRDLEACARRLARAELGNPRRVEGRHLVLGDLGERGVTRSEASDERDR